ncbi:methionyl-tRNA formyltransferase [Ohtaekwangia koreensis]|nr:formyltransferase family protein [Ohtaekwangia koreensis]
MSYKGFAVLKHLIEKRQSAIIDSVIIGEDKAVQNDYSDAIAKLCTDNNLKFFNRKDIYTITSPYCFVISWRWMIQADHAEIIVLHDSLLPKYRGFAPLVNQLIQGEKEIGVTAIQASDEYDKGPMLLQKSAPVQYPLKIKEAIEIASGLYIQIAEDFFQMLLDNTKFTYTDQNEAQATYSLWRDDEDYKIDWSQDAASIVRFIDAVGYPYMGASAFLGHEKIRIEDAEEYRDVTIVNRDAGKIIFMEDGKPIVVCGSGLIKLKEARYDNSQISIFPLQKFRIRFK